MKSRAFFQICGVVQNQPKIGFLSISNKENFKVMLEVLVEDTDASGKPRSQVYDIEVLHRPLADYAKNLSPGQFVRVEGRPNWHSYISKEGKPQKYRTLTAFSILQEISDVPPASLPPQGDPDVPLDYEEDVPF